MRILVLSFYYYPDLCAGSFRTTPLVAALRERAPPGTHLDVITTLPNRYHTFTREAEELESAPGIEIRRIKLPPHQSDMPGQARAFLHFARRVRSIVAHRKYDVVFATSSRLMTAALGASIARRKRAALYLDIRDIFADTIKDVLPPVFGWPAGWMFSLIESWTVRRASRINLVSRGFEGYFRRRYGDRPMAWFTNGIDAEFLVRRQSEPHRKGEDDPRTTILYAGNIGAGQALEQMIPMLAHALRSEARFIVIGDGGRRAALEAALVARGVDNVEVRAPMQRSALLEAYESADVLFLHLGDCPAFEKVLPSKVFEYAALGKPLLAGIAGYSARFVREEIRNSAVFPPCDLTAAVQAFRSLELADCPRPEFVAKYSRATIARQMADDVLALLPRRE